MSAFFTSASSQRLSNAGVTVTAVPFTVGFWVYPTTTSVSKIFWSLADTGASNNYFDIGQNATNQWTIEARAGGTNAASSIGTVTANAWAFVLGRFISATSRRFDVLQFDGSEVNIQNTTSRAPTSIDRMSLGCQDMLTPGSFFDGNVAEFWYTNTDIIGSDVATNTDFVRQLAYGGPFSVSYIIKDIQEYHSLKDHLSSDTFSNESDILPLLGETFTNVGSVTVGQHPPLPYWYSSAQDRSIPFIV